MAESVGGSSLCHLCGSADIETDYSKGESVSTGFVASASIVCNASHFRDL